MGGRVPVHSLSTQKHVTDHHRKIDTEVLVEPWHAEQLENFVLTVSTVIGKKVTETVFTKQLLRTTHGEKNIHSGPREPSTAPLLTGQDSKQREPALVEDTLAVATRLLLLHTVGLDCRPLLALSFAECGT